MLEARGLTVTTARVTRLCELSAVVKPGELTALIGPNGAGKTTLLDCLAGSLLPSKGQILLEGKTLSQWAPLALARRRAVLPQRSTLNFPFTVLEVVLMGRTPYWLGHEEQVKDREIAMQAMDATDCLHLQNKCYTRLSGGEQQRVQLARVLTQVWNCNPEAPAYLLLDEPVSSLDLAHQFSLMEFLKKFAGQGAGVLVVMHDLNLVKRYADSLWVLSKGSMVENGTVLDCLKADLIQQVFEVSAEAVLSL